jgi:hypothetical protein
MSGKAFCFGLYDDDGDVIVLGEVLAEIPDCHE